jgi:thiol-disulfide isomerase/thioredoxin
MKYLCLFFCFLFLHSSIGFTQNRPIEKGAVILPNGVSVRGDNLTETEKDSLRKGFFPDGVTAKWEIEHKKNMLRRDSLLKTMVGKPVPDFDAKDTEGYTHPPHLYRGRVLILHFWSFWDYSFYNEIPALNHLAEKYQQEGVQILSFVNMPLGESEKEHLKTRPLAFPLVDNAYKFSNNFLLTNLWTPFIVIVDKNGLMRYFYMSENLTTIRSHLNEKVVDIKRPTYDFEEKILELLKGM